MSEWTPLTGLRRATVRVLLRAVPATVILAAMFWLMTPVLHLFTTAIFGGSFGGMIGTFVVFGFVFVLVGLALGYGLCRQVAEIAGFASIVLTSIVLAIAVGAIALATSLTSLHRPLGSWQAFIIVAVALGAAVNIFRATLIDT